MSEKENVDDKDFVEATHLEGENSSGKLCSA